MSAGCSKAHGTAFNGETVVAIREDAVFIKARTPLACHSCSGRWVCAPGYVKATVPGPVLTNASFRADPAGDGERGIGIGNVYDRSTIRSGLHASAQCEAAGKGGGGTGVAVGTLAEDGARPAHERGTVCELASDMVEGTGKGVGSTGTRD